VPFFSSTSLGKLADERTMAIDHMLYDQMYEKTLDTLELTLARSSQPSVITASCMLSAVFISGTNYSRGRIDKNSLTDFLEKYIDHFTTQGMGIKSQGLFFSTSSYRQTTRFLREIADAAGRSVNRFIRAVRAEKESPDKIATDSLTPYLLEFNEISAKYDRQLLSDDDAKHVYRCYVEMINSL
jgi:hypothetical protein